MSKKEPIASGGPPPDWGRIPAADGWRVAWTRGEGCAEIAAMLDPATTRVTGDRLQYLIDRRVNLFVSKKIANSFDLIDSIDDAKQACLMLGGFSVPVVNESGAAVGMFDLVSY